MADKDEKRINWKVGQILFGYVAIRRICDCTASRPVYGVKRDEETRYQMTLEKVGEKGYSVLKWEADVLKQLQPENVFPTLIDSGRKKGYQFLVLDVLGPTLHDLKANCQLGTFSQGTWSRVGMQCLHALKVLHSKGFVHRNLSPNNFALALRDYRRIILCDFSSAFQFVESKQARDASEERKLSSSGAKPKRQPKRSQVDMSRCSEAGGRKFRVPRMNTKFRGTTMYASYHAHNLADLSRHDDIWSLMYVIASLFTQLPWAIDKRDVWEKKFKTPLLLLFTASSFQLCGEPRQKILAERIPNKFTEDMRVMIGSIDEMLRMCTFVDGPDYELVHKFFHSAMVASKTSLEDPYDWSNFRELTYYEGLWEDIWEDVSEWDKRRNLKKPVKPSTPVIEESEESE